MNVPIRSAIYLAGNKYRLIKDILQHLQDGTRDTFVDVFGGSGCMTLNVVNNNMFSNYIYNEKAWFLYGLQDSIKNSRTFLGDIKTVNSMYPCSKEGYLCMRADYNDEGAYKNYAQLYNLQCRSNSNMMRFSKTTGFNMPYGERHCFNAERVKVHRDLLKTVILWNKDFGDAIESLLNQGSLDKVVVYLDPTYSNTLATYNEGDSWSENDNTTLLEYCKELQIRGAKVLISNVFSNRGNVNQEIIDWCKDNEDSFYVKHLDISYNNSSYRKSKGVTDEVLIISR